MVRAHAQDHPADPWVVIFAHSQSRKHVVVQKQKLSLLKTILLRWKKHSTRLDLRRIAFVTYFFALSFLATLITLPPPPLPTPIPCAFFNHELTRTTITRSRGTPACPAAQLYHHQHHHLHSICGAYWYFAALDPFTYHRDLHARNRLLPGRCRR